jgi:hypothetical protein
VPSHDARAAENYLAKETATPGHEQPHDTGLYLFCLREKVTDEQFSQPFGAHEMTEAECRVYPTKEATTATIVRLPAIPERLRLT